MTALEAKNAFGQFLDAVQREPVLVTKKSRPVAAMFSIEDIEELCRAYLPAPEQENLTKTSNAEEKVDALMRQARIDSRILQAKAEIAAGDGIVMDDAYFDRLRERVVSKTQIR